MRRIRGKRNEARGKKIKISSLFRPLASDLRLFPRTGLCSWTLGRFFPLFQLLPDPRPHTLDPVLGERPRTWTRSVGTKNLGAKHQNNELLSLPRTWTRSVGTMNRSACLDPKSPLERGGPLAVGSVLFEMPLTSFFAFFALSSRSGLVRDLAQSSAVRLKAVNPLIACKSSVASSKMQVVRKSIRTGLGVAVRGRKEHVEPAKASPRSGPCVH